MANISIIHTKMNSFPKCLTNIAISINIIYLFFVLFYLRTKGFLICQVIEIAITLNVCVNYLLFLIEFKAGKVSSIF